MISEAILIPKIYARLQEIASNFSKLYAGGPGSPAGARDFGARFGASPPYRAPQIQNSWIRPWTDRQTDGRNCDHNDVVVCNVLMFEIV